MKDYLLDTNIWSHWYNPDKNDYVLRHLKEKPDCRLHISVVSLGELHYGYDVCKPEEKCKLGSLFEFVKGQTPGILKIDRHISKIYGEIRAILFDKYAPGKLRKKGMRPEQLVDPCSSLQLQIQENDLWIVAQAINWSLVLATNDKKMRRIWEVAGDDLQAEIWE